MRQKINADTDQMMKKCLVLLIAAATGLGACVAPGTSAWGTKEAVYILVKTAPTGATITFLDGTVCESPCRVGVVDPLQMTVARAGYEAQTRTLHRTSPSPLLLTLVPVGRSQAVEEFSLPDL